MTNIHLLKITHKLFKIGWSDYSFEAVNPEPNWIRLVIESELLCFVNSLAGVATLIKRDYLNQHQGYNMNK